MFGFIVKKIGFIVVKNIFGNILISFSIKISFKMHTGLNNKEAITVHTWELVYIV